MGLVRVQADCKFDHADTKLPASGLIVTGDDLVTRGSVWRDARSAGALARLEDASSRPVRTEARVVPIPDAAGPLRRDGDGGEPARWVGVVVRGDPV